MHRNTPDRPTPRDVLINVTAWILMPIAAWLIALVALRLIASLFRSML